MANTKISGLGAIAAIALEDLIAVVDDPSGTPATTKATIAQLFGFLKFDQILRATGDLTLNNTSWTDVPTISTLSFPAATGDLVFVGVSALMENNAITGYLDVHSEGGAAEAVWSLDGAAVAASGGIQGLRAQGSMDQAAGVAVPRIIIANDLNAGTLTLRLSYKTSSASNKTLFASANVPLHFWALNLGPVTAT